MCDRFRASASQHTYTHLTNTYIFSLFSRCPCNAPCIRSHSLFITALTRRTYIFTCVQPTFFNAPERSVTIHMRKRKYLNTYTHRPSASIRLRRDFSVICTRKTQQLMLWHTLRFQFPTRPEILFFTRIDGWRSEWQKSLKQEPGINVCT